MKKLLLNYKSINCAFLLILVGANTVSGQTVFEETFGTAANPTYTGGTSTTPNAVNYTTNTDFGVVSTVLPPSSTDAFLQLTGSAAATQTTPSARPNISFPYSGISSSFNTTLVNNTNAVTWSFNMRTGRLLSSSVQSYADGAYYGAIILCATNATFAGGTASGTNGYAIIFQRSSTDAAKNSIRLVKFSNGIGSSALGSAVTPLIQTPAFATPSATSQNNISVKVVYTKNAPNPWELFYREDSATTPWATVDPLSGNLTNVGSSSDNTYTSTAMTHFGILASSNASTTSTNNQQFDNFKISLSPLPPSVEKRQSFNNVGSTPTVANLVATGTNVKWFAAATSGTQLATNTPLTYTNFYASQTINGTESERAACQVFVGDIALRTLPFHENFSNYTIGDKLILMNNGATTAVDTNQGTGLGSWTMTPSSNITDDVFIVASPTWTNTLVPTATGNAITFVGSGIDPELKFTDTTSGSLYSSFLFNAVDAPSSIVASTTTDANYSTPTGFYSFMALSPSTVTPGTFNNDYASALMFRKNIVSGKYNLGLSKSSSETECVWSATEYDFNTQHLIVISYENIGDATATNQVSKLWINPTTNTTPLPPPTLTQNNPTTSVSRNNIDRIKILQASSSSTPTLIIDEIRVANNWGQALGGAATLGLVNNSISKLSIYPNPVTNGELFISSTSNLEKEVIIYTTLGQKVLQDKTVSEAVNVSTLTPGTYFVKITEAGLTTTKKLIIK